MASAISHPDDAPARKAFPLAGLAIFLAVQVLSLALSAARVEFSAGFVRPAEVAATHQLLIFQAIAITLLFAWIARTVWSAAAAGASLWPMLILSSLLAGGPAEGIIAPALHLILWLVALVILSYKLRTNRSRLLALAFAASWCAAGPLAWYLRREFAENVMPIPGWLAGPVRGSALLLDDWSNVSVWLAAVGAVVISSVMAMSCAIARRRLSKSA